MRRTTPLLAAGIGALLLPLGALTAGAATGTDDGLWYVEASHLDEVHRTSTGEGITIAVLDTPINPGFADLVGTDLVVHEPSYCAAAEGGPALPATGTDPGANHATGIASLLIGTGTGIAGQPGIPGVAPGITLRHYAVAAEETQSGQRSCAQPGDGQDYGMSDALDQAIADGADVVSISRDGGTLSDDTLVAAHEAGVVIVASAGNTPTDHVGYPASANSVLSVASLTPEGALWENNPTGPELAVIAPGVRMRAPSSTFDGYMLVDGSSLAAPYTAGVLALAWSQHPDATGDQMIQALLRTTDGTTHDLIRDDSWGYGVVSAEQLLRIDPTTLPDTNPLLYDAPERLPAVSVFSTAPAPTAPETAAPATTTKPEPTTPTTEHSSSSTGLLIAVAAAAVLVLGLAALLLLRARRRPAPTASGGHDEQL